MKKLIAALIAFGLIFAAAALAAETAKDYTVKTVTGKVEAEITKGTWTAVTAGMVLKAGTALSTGLNSSVVLVSGDKTVTVKALQKDSVDTLFAAALAAGPGIKLGSMASGTSVTGETGPARTNVSTASTRASEATDELEWVDSE